MISQQQTANKPFDFVGGGIGAPRVAGHDAGSRLKRRFDTRREDDADQVEAERRDLSAVAVLGYN